MFRKRTICAMRNKICHKVWSASDRRFRFDVYSIFKKNETCETPDLCQTNSFRSNRVLETYNLRLIVKYSLDLIAALVATVVTSYILLHIAWMKQTQTKMRPVVPFQYSKKHAILDKLKALSRFDSAMPHLVAWHRSRAKGQGLWPVRLKCLQRWYRQARGERTSRWFSHCSFRAENWRR